MVNKEFNIEKKIMSPRKVVIELNDDNKTYNIKSYGVLTFTKENTDGILIDVTVPKANIIWSTGILPESYEILNGNDDNLFTFSEKEDE